MRESLSARDIPLLLRMSRLDCSTLAVEESALHSVTLVAQFSMSANTWLRQVKDDYFDSGASCTSGPTSILQSAVA